jgi:hypothetical protein
VTTIKQNAMISIVVLSFGLPATMALAQPQLVNNGGFETGPAGVQQFPNWDWLGPADNNSDYGVAQTSSATNVAEQGKLYAYFHGYPTDGSQDCLGQSVYLTVGARYNISYYLGTDGPTAGSGASMWVVIGTSFGIDLSQDIALPSFFPNSPNALPYQLFTTNIVATSASEILSFHGIDSASSILLDNVSMTAAVPQLNLSLSSTNTLVFNWIGPARAFAVQASASLGSTNWVRLTNTPVITGPTNKIMLPPPASSQFYRLIST